MQAGLVELGVRPRRSWGQSFLTDAFVADAEAALVEVPRDSPILEVGGGLGILTEALLRRGFSRLTVIERDARLVAHLRRRFPGQIRVIESDALSSDWDHPEVLVGNLPFSVGTPLLVRAFERAVPRVVGMIQREVAARLAAAPGSRAYGRLTILAAAYGQVELFQVVPARAFEPVPAVDGQLFRFRRRTDALPVPSMPALEAMLRPLFGERRKQLKNLLPKVLPQGRDPGEIATRAGWPDDWPRLRPEDLTPAAYFALARTLGEAI